MDCYRAREPKRFVWAEQFVRTRRDLSAPHSSRAPQISWTPFKRWQFVFRAPKVEPRCGCVCVSLCAFTNSDDASDFGSDKFVLMARRARIIGTTTSLDCARLSCATLSRNVSAVAELSPDRFARVAPVTVVRRSDNDCASCSGNNSNSNSSSSNNDDDNNDDNDDDDSTKTTLMH